MADPCTSQTTLDAVVLAALERASAETYVIRNRLAMRGVRMTTGHVRAALRRLVASGKAEAGPTGYARMLAWRLKA